jgi:hypothetical protein
MATTHPETRTSRQFQGLIRRAHPMSGTEDDDDERDDEHAGENEALVCAANEGTETPEEFEMLGKGKLDDPEDDDAGEEEEDDEEEEDQEMAPTGR